MENSQETISNNKEMTATNDYSPLAQPVVQRSYTNHATTGDVSPEPLPVASFPTPTYDDEISEETGQNNNPSSFNSNSQGIESESRPFNQEYSELPNKEKAMGAEMMAEMVLDLYGKGCGFLGKLPQMSEQKLDRLIAEGELDSRLVIETQAGDMPVKEFAVEYNKTFKEAFEVSDEFRENVKPPLERVFKKRGLGMTDEQLLIYYFATDFGAKGVQAFMMRKQTNEIIDNLKQQTLRLQEISSVNNRTVSNQQPTQPHQAPPSPATPYVEQAVTGNQNQNGMDDYTTDIASHVQNNPAPIVDRKRTVARKRPTAKPKPEATNLEVQVANFAEPEEVENGVFSNLNPRGGFSGEFNEPTSNPKFGDVEILSGLDKVESEVPRRPMSRKKPNSKK